MYNARMSNSDNSKKHRLTPSSVSQIQILSAMADGVSEGGEAKRYQIHEVAELSRLADEKETLRFLYILEGQKLVSPFPPGDFTARVWYITDQGIETLKQITKSIAA